MENIDNILLQLNAIEKVEISDKIWNIIDFETKNSNIIKLENNQKWLVAASILILLSINLYSIIQFSNHSKSTIKEQNIVYQAYFANN